MPNQTSRMPGWRIADDACGFDGCAFGGGKNKSGCVTTAGGNWASCVAASMGQAHPALANADRIKLRRVNIHICPSVARTVGACPEHTPKLRTHHVKWTHMGEAPQGGLAKRIPPLEAGATPSTKPFSKLAPRRLSNQFQPLEARVPVRRRNPPR